MQAVVGLPSAAAVVPQGRAAAAAAESAGVSSCLAFARASRAVSLRTGGRFGLVGGKAPIQGSPLQRQQWRRASTRIVALELATEPNVKWVLESVGDGSAKHLAQPVPLPSTFELTSESTTLGRSPDKADVVLNIATVSGLHARLEKKGNVLYVTDQGSTNGTYINDRKLSPQKPSPVPPGSLLTFGDEHLAVFKFLQTEDEDGSAESETVESKEAPSA